MSHPPVFPIPGRKVERGYGAWPIDPLVAMNHSFGTCLPAPGDHRRCQDAEPRSRNQCQQWALKGTPFCKLHSKSTHPRGFKRSRHGRQNIYSKYLSDDLKGKLERFAEEEQQRLDLASEVDVTRMLAEQAFAIFDTVHGSRKDEVDDEMRLKPERALVRAEPE